MGLGFDEKKISVIPGTMSFQHMTLVAMVDVPEANFTSIQFYTCNTKYKELSVVPGHPTTFATVAYRIIQLWKEARLLPLINYHHVYVSMNPFVLGQKKDYWLKNSVTATVATPTIPATPVTVAAAIPVATATITNSVATSLVPVPQKMDEEKMELALKTLTKYSQLDQPCRCTRCL